MVVALAKKGWFLLPLAVAVALLQWYAGSTRDAAFHKADHSACVRIEALKVGFRDSLDRGLKTLGGYAYYKDHPTERARAVAEIHRQLRLYAPSDC